MQPHRGVILFLLGALGGSAVDTLAVYTGTKFYPPPYTLFGVAWWVPLFMGIAAMLIGYSHPYADSLLHHRRTRHPISSFGGLGWLLLAYLIAVSQLESIAKLGILVLIYLNFWMFMSRSWQNLLLSIVTAITGTLIEMILVAIGVFSYLHPDILGVPYWLPCIFACASLTMGEIGRSLSLHLYT